jgi:hypothetical protein
MNHMDPFTIVLGHTAILYESYGSLYLDPFTIVLGRMAILYESYGSLYYSVRPHGHPLWNKHCYEIATSTSMTRNWQWSHSTSCPSTHFHKKIQSDSSLMFIYKGAYMLPSTVQSFSGTRFPRHKDFSLSGTIRSCFNDASFCCHQYRSWQGMSLPLMLSIADLRFQCNNLQSFGAEWLANANQSFNHSR